MIEKDMSRSAELYNESKSYIPGAVNSPVRAFNGVGGTPVFAESADGAYFTDVDGKQYIDYVGSWGPMVHGHNHPAIREAVVNAASNGLSFGAPTEIELTMAKKVCELIPSVEQVRMVSSGTEATMFKVIVNVLGVSCAGVLCPICAMVKPATDNGAEPLSPLCISILGKTIPVDSI